jgi:hypothetical protein
VSIAHLVREVDVQPSHPGSSLHGCEFGFLFSKKKKIAVGASPTAFPFKKNPNRKVLGLIFKNNKILVGITILK